ncbi:MAG: 50S ribosomal protein L34e [Candidatus Nanoarchaeia archaeon]
MQHKTKSRTFARKAVRTAKGTKIVYTRRKPKQGTCSVTGQTLKGVPRALPTKMKNMPKTKKRPTRPFGGVLSSKAAREEIKNRARKLEL